MNIYERLLNLKKIGKLTMVLHVLINIRSKIKSSQDNVLIYSIIGVFIYKSFLYYSPTSQKNYTYGD